MGILIIQKSDPNVRIENPKLALVLAGGAVSGGAFKVGGLKALNDYLVNRKVTDFDIYVGLSAGAFLTAPIAGGIPPEEMLASLDGTSKIFGQLSPLEFYHPNLQEFFERPLKYLYGNMAFVPGILYDIMSSFPNLQKGFWKNLMELVKHPSYSTYEQLMKPIFRVAYTTRTMPSLGELLPSGIFDNTPLEAYLRRNMKANRMPNNFKVLKRVTGKSLYIVATNLDNAQRVVFGPDEKNDVTISEAIQASTAVPGFYKPARIKGIDYIDGGVRRTANVDVAFDKGADLVICYNPFRPFHNDVLIEYLREENKYVTKQKRISDGGIGMVLNQVFRTLFHSRLMISLQSYVEDTAFKKDIILIEPKEDERDFFEINPLFFWNRAKSAAHGFASVSASIERHYEPVSALLKRYGLEMSRDLVKKDVNAIANSRYDDTVIMNVLEKRHPRRGLRMMSGGKST